MTSASSGGVRKNKLKIKSGTITKTATCLDILEVVTPTVARRVLCSLPMWVCSALASDVLDLLSCTMLVRLIRVGSLSLCLILPSLVHGTCRRRCV